MTSSLRRDAPELWRDIVSWCRDIGIDWPEDDIASVIGKIHARTPDALPDTIGTVLEWCRAAEGSDDAEVQATVSLWRQLPRDVIMISLSEEGHVRHRLTAEPGTEVLP